MTTKQADQPLWKQFRDRCVHFTGIHHEACAVGVNYEQIAAPPAGPAQPRFGIARRLPCFVADGHTDRCPHFRTMTDEEAQAKEREIMEGFAQFWRDIDAGICPNHHTPMLLRQVGQFVYADPCGCRLYQGRIKAAEPVRKITKPLLPRYVTMIDPATGRKRIVRREVRS